jgi:outer membrane receptor for ferrienterochelin and colicin
MRRRKSRMYRAAILATTVCASSLLFAQTTDSTIRVSVTDASGNPIANSRIEIIHTPTGKSKIYTSGDGGRVTARGMRVGGPYTIKFPDGSQYTGESISDLFTAVGQTAAVSLQVGTRSSSNMLEEVVVQGMMSTVETNVGPGSTFTRDRLDSTPSLSRDISSMLQQDARANFDTQTGNLSIAGSNNRFNSLTVDGVRQNDDFGLNLNGSPTNKSPISLDAIESIALNIAPFGVEYGSFQGGNVNVVTKSGTNEFHGTAFYTYSDDSLIGDKSEGESLKSETFEDSTWGVSVGGPIIEDKLFFFFSYEQSETSTPFPFSLGNDDGVTSANEIDVVTQAQMDRALQIAQDEYGYDGGAFDADHGTEDDRLLIKLDWEINQDHRMSMTYQNTDGTKVVDDFTFFRNPTFASPESHRFNSRQELTALSFNLYSDWGDKLSTEFKYATKEVATDNRSIGADGVGEAHISTMSPNGQAGVIHIGPDHFRHANDLDNDLTALKLVATYALNDDHTITAGFERDTLEIYNQFVPWSKGEFFYGSIDDYENHNAFMAVYGNAITGNPADRTAEFESTTDTFYLQDEWLATQDLTLTFGLRYETVTNDDGPVYNANFEARTGFRNDYVFDGESILLPRIGLEYQLNDRTVVRAGVGQFGGGTPNVWISNGYAQDGIRGNFRKSLRGAFDQLNGIPQALIDIVSTVDANADVDAVKPGTELASVWKYNLGVEHDLDLGMLGMGDDWQLQGDVLITEVEDAYIWTEKRQALTGATAPDGRPIRTFGFSRDILMTTTDKGHGEVYTLQLSKAFESDYGEFNFSLGYSHQHINEVNPGARFTAFDTYGSPAHVDAEDQLDGVLYAANTETQDRFTSNLIWSHQLFGDNITSATLAYVGRSGKNYSHTYQGGGPFGGYGLLGDFSPKLMYVPTGVDDPLVTYGDNIDAQTFNDYISGESCLSNARGGIVKRNTCQNDWVHRFDLRLSQEIKVKGDHAFLLFLDIENLGNLINDDWGRYEEYPFNTPTVTANISDDGSQYVYSNFTAAPGKAVYKIPSVWKAQLGFRYSF